MLVDITAAVSATHFKEAFPFLSHRSDYLFKKDDYGKKHMLCFQKW